MADLDTREKRSSGVHVASPWRAMYPLPDGTIGQPDRQHIAFLYSAIAADAPVAATLQMRIPQWA